VVHAHDWQAGLSPAYLHYAGAIEPPTVMTIHNLAFQGQFPAYLLAFLGLPAEAFTVQGVEYYGSIGYLKAGLQFADRITTVSPTYAAEIRTPAGGVGMDGRCGHAPMCCPASSMASTRPCGIRRATHISQRRSMPIDRRRVPRTRRPYRSGSDCGAIRRSCCSA
jgi:hypothetical protein